MRPSYPYNWPLYQKDCLYIETDPWIPVWWTQSLKHTGKCDVRLSGYCTENWQTIRELYQIILWIFDIVIRNDLWRSNKGCMQKDHIALKSSKCYISSWLVPENNLGPLYLYGLNLIPVWIHNCIHYKMWVKLLIHSQTTTVQQLKFGNR